MEVREYSEDWQSRWDDYVCQSSCATLFHGTSWKDAIEQAFGYKSCYLLAHEGGRICGLLPLFLCSNPFFGRSLISTPFATYGGICADSDEAYQLIVSAAVTKAQHDRVQYLELRERTPRRLDGFRTKALYVTFDCKLSADTDGMLAALPRDTRYMIRKAIKRGLRAETDSRHLDLCYDVYAYSVHQLGTPVFPRRYFHILRERFGNDMEVMVVWNGSQPVSAVLSFRFRDWILPYYGGSLAEGRRLAANNFMYWELMKNAAGRGIRHFDFGRSKLNTGAYTFKTSWIMRESPLPYQYYLVKKNSLPNYSPSNSQFKLAIEAWKRIPLPVSKILGPHLVRMFP